MRFILFVFFSFLVSSLCGQHLKFKNFTTNNGLSNNSISDIESDKDGGLWIATWDGLNYFDGYNFVTYKNDVKDENSIPGNYILDVDKDASGAIWVFTNEGKIAKYLGNLKFLNFQFKHKVTALTISKKGNALVKVGSNYYEFKNNVFVISDNNTVQVEKYQIFRDMLLAKHPTLIINDVLKDKKGNIWIATRRSGLYIIPNSSSNLHNKQINHYAFDLYSPYSFNSNEIVKLHTDTFGNIWLGQKDGGISMAYQGSELISTVIPHPVKFPHLPSETIRAITKDFNGQVWLGYYTQGLYYYEYSTGCYLKYTIKEQTDNSDWNRIRSLFTSSDGSVWVGTYAGLLRINKGRYQLYESKQIPNFPNNRNYSIYEDEHKALWIACWGGLAKFNLRTNAFESFKGQELLSDYNFRNVKKIDDELILATETKGVILLNIALGKKETIGMADGILGNSVYSVFKDIKTNYYWIASLGGLSIYDKTTGIVKNLTEQEGLPSHMVYGLLQNDSQVWLSTTKGLVSVDKENYKLSVNHPEEGWQAPEFSEGAYYQDAKGMLFFGGINGLNYFNPNVTNFIRSPSKIKIVVDDNEYYPINIKKEHAFNNIKIKVNQIAFLESQKQPIYYKLQGVDKDWGLLTKKEINYTDILSGDYKFYIKGKEEEDDGKPYFTLKIHKAFYETIGFYIGVSLLFMLIVLIVVFIKNRNNKKIKEKLEISIVKRTKVIEKQKQNLLKVNQELDIKNKEINKQKEKLLTLHNSLKNEDFELEKFKTFVLSEFQQPVSNIIQAGSGIKNQTHIQGEILENATQLINLITEWNYLEHVKDLGIKKKSSVHLFKVIKNILESKKEVFENNDVSFISTIDQNIKWIGVDVLRFKLLLEYFFNDLIKYSNVKSNLELSFVLENSFLTLTVISNSDLLVSNWESVISYSYYYKAFTILLNDLKGNVELINKKEEFKWKLKIPIEQLKTGFEQVETISWKHMKEQDLYTNGKKNILVLADESNVEIVIQVLSNEKCNLLVETSILNLNSAIQQIEIDVLVFYETGFTKDVVAFITKYKQVENKNQLPFVYVSEIINYQLQEQSVELGVDLIIQLPASEAYIKNKIISLTGTKTRVQENKLGKEIYKVLTQENDVETANDKLIKKSLEIIKEELSNPSFNVEVMIDKLDISRVKCYRLFKEVLSQSPSEVIISLRFQKAEYLLKNKKLNISEVSFECGFNDPKYFGKSFKKHFGVSPKVFKNQNSID